MWRHHTFFATDDFKVNSRLTLNIGARYEYTPGFASSKGYLASFDIGTGKIVVPDGKIGQISPALPELRGCGGGQQGRFPRFLPDPGRPNNIAPRIGLAFRPWGDTTVFRGGFGIYYDVTGQRLDAVSPFQIAEPTFTNPTPNPSVILPGVFPQTGVDGPPVCRFQLPLTPI